MYPEEQHRGRSGNTGPLQTQGRVAAESRVHDPLAWVQIHLPTTWPQESSLTSLSLSFLVYKMGVTTAPSRSRYGN